MLPCSPGAGMLWILLLAVAFVHMQPKEGQKTPLCGLSAEKNISSLTIWLTAVFRAKVHLVWKTFSVTHFLGYSAIREEWNKKVKRERERERERERRKSKRKGYLSGIISASRAPWLVQHIPKASHPSSTLRSAPKGLHFPFPIWSF